MGIEAEAKLILAQPAAVADPGSRIFRAIEESASAVAGARPEKVVCYNGLDMIYYLQRGYEAATYGPGARGAPHAPDEYVEVGDVITFAKIYADLYFRLLQGNQ